MPRRVQAASPQVAVAERNAGVSNGHSGLVAGRAACLHMRQSRVTWTWFFKSALKEVPVVASMMS